MLKIFVSVKCLQNCYKSHFYGKAYIKTVGKKMLTKIPNLKKDKVGIKEKFCKLRVRFKQAYYYYYYYYYYYQVIREILFAA